MNIDRVKAALESNHHNKSAYIGRVQQTEKVTVLTEDGTPIEQEVTFYISWDSIEKILDMVRTRSGI